MARQKGIIKIEGTVGDLTFYKSKDGHLVKEKGGIPADRIANDPNFQRTRENGAEFGRAGKAGKLLRNAARGLMQNSKDPLVVSRLTTEMLLAIQADSTSQRGLRNIVDGDVSLLNGFDFNINAKLSTTIYAPYTPAINRVAGTLIVNVPPFIPLNMLAAPSGATHYKIVSAGAEIDFANGISRSDLQESAILPWDNVLSADLTLTNNVTPNSTNPLFLLLGIQFFQDVNGTKYPLKNGAFNSLGIVGIDAP